ncbi:MAG: zinc-ribbon domain-containing protein [Alphaproteobacteria bacterium]
MIIRCPGCQKRYDIAQHIVAQKKQYKLRCSECHTSWQLSTEPTRSPLPTSNAPKKHLPPPKIYSTWHDLIKRYSLDLVVLLAAVAIVVLLIIYQGKHIRDFYNASRFFASTPVVVPPKGTAKTAELKIESVAFSTTEQDGHLRFMVKGEIFNSSNITVASPDLRIIARGECTANPNDVSQRCSIAQWVHPMHGALIPAGKRHLFQTFAPHQGSITAKEVEIAGIQSTSKEGR